MPREFRLYEPDQGLLLPPSLRDWLPEGHLAFFIPDAIDAMDLSAFEARYGDEEVGLVKLGTVAVLQRPDRGGRGAADHRGSRGDAEGLGCRGAASDAGAGGSEHRGASRQGAGGCRLPIGVESPGATPHEPPHGVDVRPQAEPKRGGIYVARSLNPALRARPATGSLGYWL